MSIASTQTIVQPPAEYSLFYARKWGEPVMKAQGEYTTEQRHNIGSFQVINCYVPETRQFSSISNFSKLNHEDMVNLARTQLIHFGQPFNLTLDQIRKLESKKLDEFNLKQKMAWLYEPLKKQGQTPGLELWGMGDWFETTEGRYGTMIHGGQMVACTKEIFEMTISLTGEKTARPVRLRKILPFRRSDWGKTHTEYPWLIQKCTVAFHPGSRYSENSKGTIYAPVALDWRDFPFAGQAVPSGFFIPDDWLVAV